MNIFHHLFYSGPSIAVLHDTYAKKGLIDTRTPIQATSSIIIQAPVKTVWEILADVEQWNTWLPDVKIIELDTGITVDTAFTWKNGVSTIQSRFAVVLPHKELTWTGVSSGAKAIDRHILTSTPEGFTRVYTEESMAGPLLTLFFSSEKLKSGQEAWLGALKQVAEQRVNQVGA